MNTIEAEWELFAKAVLPNNVSAIQRQEMRKAFYCGAEMMRLKMLELADKSEDAAMALIAAYGEEFEIFTLRILKGEA